jgi:tetratricopeptide (TPR) repeat protein
MVKFTPRIVGSGLVATIVLGGLVSAENCPVAALPTSMPLGNQTTAHDSWKRTQYLAQSFQSQSQKELAEYTEAIRRDPKNAEAYMLRGRLRSNLFIKDVYDLQGGIADYTEAIRLNPKNAEAYDGRATARMWAGDSQGAIADYTEAIRLNPRNTQYYSSRGWHRNRLRDYQGALADYTEAIRLNPKDNGLNYNYSVRGDLRRALGDFQGALADHTENIRLKFKTASQSTFGIGISNDGIYYANRGKIRSDLGDYQGALADFSEAIRTSPENTYVYAMRAELLTTQENFQDALRDANQAVKNSDIFSIGFIARGAARTGLGDYQGAQQDFEQALKRLDGSGGSSDVEFYYWRGWLYLKQGKLQKAIADYEKATQKFPSINRSKAYKDYSLIARSQLNTPVASQPALPTTATKPQPTTTAAIDPPKPAVAPSPPNVYKIAKATTLLIEGQGSGSGVIISKVGNTYFVLTAKHVVQSQQEYTVTTPSGKKHPLDYKQIKKLANLDLAVAQFTSNENLSVAQLGNSETVSQGDIIYVSGWPSSDQGIDGEEALTTDGKVASIRSGHKDGYDLIYTNPTGQGMSGGPILDSNARLVGIHGGAAGNEERGKNGINLGIPVHLFLRQAPQAGLNLKQLGLRAEK